MPIKPLPMPKLSELPNPVEDLIGGASNPASLMTPSEESVEGLYNPEPPKIKLSRQATEALSSAAKQKQQLIDETLRRQQQEQQAQLKALEAEAKASQDRQKAYIKAEEERRKQIEEAQGGMLGAAKDGSFLLEGAAKELIAHEDWQGIVSDMQRNDLMEQWLAERENELRQAGVNEEIIANEIAAGRRVISSDTTTYANTMKSDNLDPLDLGTSTLKAFNTLPALGSLLIGYEEGVRNAAKRDEALNETYSDTLLLDQANFNYLQAKASEEDPDAAWWKKAGSTVKNVWDSGYTTGLVVDNLGYIPLSALGGTVVMKGLGVAAKAARPGLAVASKAAPAAWTGKTAAKLINPQTIGTAITSGTLAATDAGSGAFEAVDSLDMSNSEDVEALRSNYIDSYSKGNWDALVNRHNGDLEAVKGELAISAGREAAGWGALVGAVSSGFDLDKAVIGMTTGGLRFQAGRRLRTIGINTVSETLEEAFTQVAQNLGANAYTGVDLSEGTAEAGVLGAVAGGITSAAIQGVGQLAQGREAVDNAPSFDPNQLSASNYVTEGNLDLEKYRVAVGVQFGNIASDAYAVGMTADEAQQLQQQTFDNVLDDPNKWAAMTPEQQESFKEYLQLEWGINTNDYAQHRTTPHIKAYNSGDLDAVKKTGNEMLVGAFRVANGVEVDQVDPAARPTYEAVAEILARMSALPSDVNTHQREQQFRQVFKEVVAEKELTDIQKAGIATFMFNGADAGSRRLTDAEQIKQNTVNQVAAKVEREGVDGAQEQEEGVQGGRGNSEENAGSQPTTSPTAGRRGKRAESSQAQEVGEPTQGDTGSDNPQGPRNGSARQAANARPTGDAAAQAGASPSGNVGGAEQVQRVGGNQATTAAPTAVSGTSPSQGVISPTVGSGQSTGQTNTNATQETRSSGSTGAAQTERSADGVGAETSQAEQIALGEFNLQEILLGVTNARGEKSPSLNQLAPEDDSADRPTIRLTIDGKSYEGRLFRYRKDNKRYIAFVVDSKAYGLKDAGDNWVSFGAGVGTKRVNSINQQTDISIQVLDAPVQTQQESENAQAESIEDSPPPTEDGGENQRNTDRVGNVPQSDDQSGEGSGPNGQRDESGSQETSRESEASRPLGGWNSLEELGEGTQRVEDVITDEETVAIEDFLDENNEPDLTAAEFVEQVAVSRQMNDTTSSDPLINLAEDTPHIRRIINRIMKRLRNFLGMVSMAIAVGTGVNLTITTDAEAAVDLTPATGEVVMTSKAKASLDHILETNDNQGKPFVIADKKAGMLFLHTGDGLMVNSTPALFGKDTSDARYTSKATGAGRYNLSYNTDAQLPSGYEGSVQSFDTAPDGSVFAIHRVLDVAGQDRPSRLASSTARDNRITYGCINVPKEFYNDHLDGELDAVLYVLPETDSWGGTLYGTGANGTVIQDSVAGYDPATEVTPEFDNMNTTSVTLTEADINNSVDYYNITDAPAVAMQPAIIEGTNPTTQVAYTTPIVTNGASINTVYVGSEISTPAEQRADATFDTAPVTEEVDGLSLSALAVNLAALLGGGAVINRTRKKIRSKKASGGTTAVDDHNAEAAKNKKADKVPHVNANLVSDGEATADIKEGNTADWLEFISETSAVNARTGDKLDTFVQSLSTFEMAINEVLSDLSYTQAGSGVFNDRRKWRMDITDRNRSGVSAKFLNATSGATPVFDNWLQENGAEAFGYEADSSVATKMLSQVSAKTNGAYGYIHKRYVRPLITMVDRMAAEFRMPVAELEADIGNLATVTHILNEGASAFFAAKRKIIDELTINVQSIDEELGRLPSDDPSYAALQEARAKTAKEITNLEEELEIAKNTYEGKIEWDRDSVRLAGGYTKAEALEVIENLKDKYGDNFASLEDARVQTVRSIKGARQFAAANGVYTNDNLRVFQELGFKDYVPLYSEDRDPRDVDESEYVTQSSRFDRLLENVPASQAKAMGLAKDLSRYHREGATSPADNAINNFKGMAINLAKRTGQQGWLNAVQQMYEGTLGQPISAAVVKDQDKLTKMNASSNSGALPGLIRVRPGAESSLRDKDKAALGFGKAAPVLPIRAKGYNRHGDLVDYNYYFVERAIANEVYTNTNVTVTLENRALRSVGTLTRMAAGMMTKFKPVWNVYNMARDIPERISILLMRPVKDVNGQTVPKGKLLKAYASNLARISASLEAQNEIYRYLVTGETRTKLQQTLHEAALEGSINLMTSQTERHSVMADMSKSDVEKLMRAVSKSLGATMNRTGVGQVASLANSAVDYYVQRLTEVPQVTVALAAYMAYADVNVNKQEAANRVRDQYDPLRTSGPWVDSAGQLYPFLRSTMSGHYNLYRSLSEYWRPGEWQWTATFLTAGIAGMATVLGLASGLLGDDEDGVPYMARLPIDTLVQGIPIPDGQGGVRILPVGFGLPSVMWGVSANLYKLAEGEQDAGDMATSLAGIIINNSSPINVASGPALSDDVARGTILSVVPLIALPVVETAFGVRAYGGSKIYGRGTPRGERDSEQDSFTTPEIYKKWAKSLYATIGLDMRPETLRHWVESYSYGPLKAIPRSVLADKSEKTLGYQTTKGEVAGTLITALGADTGWQPNALKAETYSWRLTGKVDELLIDAGVPRSHPAEDYETYGIKKGKAGSAARLTMAKLRAMNADPQVIDFVGNTLAYEAAKRKIQKDFRQAAMRYNKIREAGGEDVALRESVERQGAALQELTEKYVRENNNAYLNLL